MHNDSLHGPQLAVSSSLQPLLEGLSAQSFDGTERHISDAKDAEHLNTNIRPIKKWTNLSVKKEEYGEHAYSPGTKGTGQKDPACR